MCPADGSVEAAWLIGVDGVEPVSRLAAAMFGDIVSQGGRVQAAAAQAKAFAKGFSGFEEFVWYRKRDFHTIVLPR